MMKIRVQDLNIYVGNGALHEKWMFGRVRMAKRRKSQINNIIY